MSAADAASGGQDLPALAGQSNDIEARYAADTWRAHELGVRAPRGRATVSFTGVSPPWLREATKRWGRQRLARNYAFNTICAGILAFKRFSAFLASCEPAVCRPEEVDRALVERYLAWVAPLPLSESTKALSRGFLRVFLDENRRYRWIENVAPDAVVYHDEVSSRRSSLPRFIPEFVMAQLESEVNLGRLRLHC